MDQLVKDAASYARQVHEAIAKRPRTDDEQKTGRRYRNTECGDGPAAMRRSPKKDAQDTRDIAQVSSTTAIHRAPKKRPASTSPNSSSGMWRSPVRCDRPLPVDSPNVHRSPKVTAPDGSQRATMVVRTPKKVVPAKVQKGPSGSPVGTVNMVRPPIKKSAFRMLASTFTRASAKQKLPAVSALASLHVNRQWQVQRKAAAVMDLVLSVHPSDPMQ